MLQARHCTYALALISAVFLGACAQTGTRIGYAVNLCCPGDYGSYASYGVRTHEMPAFLADYVIAEFDQAFQAKGLERNDRLNDLTVTLAYRHINLNPEQEQIDPFERRTVEDVVLRYAATIVVEMRETNGNRLVWAGQINRIHSVLPGEYMHEERARPAFREAFSEMLDSYPSL
jgi:hypothetical protein